MHSMFPLILEKESFVPVVSLVVKKFQNVKVASLAAWRVRCMASGR